MQSDVQKRRAERRKKIRRRRLKIAFIFFLIIAVVIFAIMCFTVLFPIKRISVSGSEIYMYPYPWIICLIVPFLGWTLFILLYIYVHTWYIFKMK